MGREAVARVEFEREARFDSPTVSFKFVNVKEFLDDKLNQWPDNTV